jgi:outer membrane protein TolC
MKKTTIIGFIFLGMLSFAFSQSPDDLFKLAGENNPGLKAKYLVFEAALEKVNQIGVMPDPTFSFGYFISPIETRVGPQRMRFSLSQKFPWFGSLQAQKDVVAMNAESRFQEFLEARNSLYYQVAAAWYPLVELSEQKLIIKESLRLLDTYQTISTSGFANGKGAMTDVLRVELMQNDARSELTILEKSQSALVASLNKLLGRPSAEPILLPDTLTYSSEAEIVSKDSMLAKNPVLAGLDAKIESTELSRIVVQKSGMPHLGAGLDYAMVGRRNDADPMGNGRDVLMPMVTVSIPIFREKYRSANRELDLIAESYALQKEDYSNALFSTYETVAFEIVKQKELIRLYEAQILETRRLEDLLLVAYRNSGTAFEEVLRMEQARLKYEKARIAAVSKLLIAQAKLDYVITNY